jgi:hypothetical protein
VWTVFSGSEHRDLCGQSSVVLSTGICVDSVQW